MNETIIEMGLPLHTMPPLLTELFKSYQNCYLLQGYLNPGPVAVAQLAITHAVREVIVRVIILRENFVLRLM